MITTFCEGAGEPSGVDEPFNDPKSVGDAEGLGEEAATAVGDGFAAGVGDTSATGDGVVPPRSDAGEFWGIGELAGSAVHQVGAARLNMIDSRACWTNAFF